MSTATKITRTFKKNNTVKAEALTIIEPPVIEAPIIESPIIGELFPNSKTCINIYNQIMPYVNTAYEEYKNNTELINNINIYISKYLKECNYNIHDGYHIKNLIYDIYNLSNDENMRIKINLIILKLLIDNGINRKSFITFYFYASTHWEYNISPCNSFIYKAVLPSKISKYVNAFNQDFIMRLIINK